MDEEWEEEENKKVEDVDVELQRFESQSSFSLSSSSRRQDGRDMISLGKKPLAVALNGRLVFVSFPFVFSLFACSGSFQVFHCFSLFFSYAMTT